MIVIRYILKHKGFILSLLVVLLISGYVGYRNRKYEFYAEAPKARKETMPYKDIRKIDKGVLYLSDKQRYEELDKGYVILSDIYYHRYEESFQSGLAIRDNFDITKEDHYKVSIYQPFQSDKVYKQWDLLALLRKSYPDEYVEKFNLGQALDGKIYLVVVTRVTNSDYSDYDRSQHLRVFDFEAGKYVDGVAMQGGMEQYRGNGPNSDYLHNSLRESLKDYGFKGIYYTDNKVKLAFEDINSGKLKDLNISSDKAYMDLFKDKKSGTLVFFGDDALERVAHLLARPDQTDMFAGTKLTADESKDGQEHELTSIEDFKVYRK